MNAVVREWIEKAEEDYAVALREHRVRKLPSHGAVCFHAQQCIEKYLKAVLTQRGIAFAKIHDLAMLLTPCLGAFPLWQALIGDMKRLSNHAVRFRYPGESADKSDAATAVRIMKACRREIRDGLGLSRTSEPDSPV